MVENICEKYHEIYLEDLVSWLDPRSYKSNFSIIQLTRCFWVFRICFERPIPCTPWTFKCSFSHFILWKNIIIPFLIHHLLVFFKQCHSQLNYVTIWKQARYDVEGMSTFIFWNLNQDFLKHEHPPTFNLYNNGLCFRPRYNGLLIEI